MHARQPAISVLIPVRNAAATLDEALASMQAQSYAHWEALLVEDGSPALLRAWCDRDARFRLLTNETRRGIVPSLNRALEAARAPVVARMDADDISLPERFQRQLELLASDPKLAVVGCRVRYFPEEHVADGARRYEEWLNSIVTPEEHARDLFVECPLAHPTLMLRTEALRKLGGYRDEGWAEDYDLCLRLWQAGHALAKVPELLLLWREGAARTSRTDPVYALDRFLRCKVRFLRATHLAGDRPALIFGAGPVGKAFGRALLDDGARLAGFVDVDPRRIGQRLHGVPVLDLEAALRLRGEVFGLGALGQPGARLQLRQVLRAAGWNDGEDYCCVA